MTSAQLVDACRVPETVTPRRVGLWEISRVGLPAGSIMRQYAEMVVSIAPYNSLTMLFRDTIDWPTSARWDYAWHDVWSEHDSLHVLHARLLARYDDRVTTTQGAWQMPRECKRALPAHYLGVSRRRSVA